jgi:hypothetical protein
VNLHRKCGRPKTGLEISMTDDRMTESDWQSRDAR